jgi:UDP-N-acetylmuramoyl-tripeptide--D-alanyl-D-alanine ligase
MLTIAEILKATGGRLIHGSPARLMKGVSIDSRTLKAGALFIAIKGDNFDGHDFIKEAVKKGAAAVIKEKNKGAKVPGRVACIEVKNTVKALGNCASLERGKYAIPVIAVTGSSGKTTAKEMIAWVLGKKFTVLKNAGTQNNHIGVPLTLLKLNPGIDMAVLEFGSNHFGEIEYLARLTGPTIGVITSIGSAHLEYFRTRENVFKEKYALVNNLRNPKIAVLNADDQFLRGRILEKTGEPFILGCGVGNKSDFFASDIKHHQGRLTFTVNLKHSVTLSTLGNHNVYHALIAVSVARLFGLSYSEIASRLSSFDFPAGRLKVVEKKRARFIDDTYNANPDSLRQALSALERCRARGRRILVIGDMLELGKQERLFHLQAGKDAAKICDVIITVGSLSRLAADAARLEGLDRNNIFVCVDTRNARDVLLNTVRVKREDIVLVKGSRRMKMEEILK